MKSQLPKANPYISKIAPYQTGQSTGELAKNLNIPVDQIIRLAANENPHGPSPKVQDVIKNYARDMSRYPEVSVLQKGIASHLNIDQNCVIAGNGSCEILEIIARTYLQTGDDSIFPAQSFVVYKLASQYMGANCVAVKSKSDFSDDLEGILAAITPKTHVIWLANINNPTGHFTSYIDVKNFIERIPSRIIVVLDEAYFEYLSPNNTEDALPWIYEFPNLIITRTFSKIYGLAGLRIGYGIAQPQITNVLHQMRGPYNCSNMGVVAAIEALKDQDYIQKSRDLNAQGIKQLASGLQKLKFKPLPAYGNFVTVDVGDAKEASKWLLSKGVVVLPLNGYNMPNHIRISVGLESENIKILELLGRMPPFTE